LDLRGSFGWASDRSMMVLHQPRKWFISKISIGIRASVNIEKMGEQCIEDGWSLM